jgi:hypothetical protein
MAFLFIAMVFEGLPQIVRVTGIGHLGQRFVNLLFCLLDILEGIQEQRSEIFFGI